MARILVVHPDDGPRAFLEARARRHHDALSVRDVASAIKSLTKYRPELILAHASAKRPDALDLLKQLKREGAAVPVIVVAETSGLPLQPSAMKLGASDFVEYPVEQETLDKAISNSLQRDKDAHGRIPPICDEEAAANLSDLETSLNKRMECFAGKNQVFIQSFVLGGGRTSKPRIAVKCPLRKKFEMPPDVYYEFIRDVCCGDPSACSAYQQFHQRYTA